MTIVALILSSLLAGAAIQDLAYQDVDSETIRGWLEDGREFKILDVRTQAEFVWVGHPQGARNIPLYFWNPQGGRIKNESFLDEVRARFAADTTLVVICLSGGRSVTASKMLVASGYTSVFNFLKGFEGEVGPGGLRTVSGWRNKDLPSSYKATEEEKYSPPRQKPQD